MAKFPGLADRLRQRLLEQGYRQDPPNQRTPDIMGFCRKRHYLPQYVYEWVNKGVTPTWANLRRLERDLDTPIAWLLLGDDGLASAIDWFRKRQRER